MKTIFIAVDVEASGPTPANYSLLSIGASVVGQTESKFYRELKPISKKYIEESMRIGCLGLKCIETIDQDKYNPKHILFQPNLVLEQLNKDAKDPKEVMEDFKNWLLKVSEGYYPILTSDCDAFDGMWIHYYFDKYNIENPFRYGGANINSIYRGLKKDINAHIKNSKLWVNKRPHNALEDAIAQAKMMEKILEKMNFKV